ncbi:HD-GYP domain-containing protein [Neobacillus massiliamazoniensis]|uniref:HD domain-containing protein n=1 Tax=Neobacillus massiliamazoniensis TaxID=1499688 RepID=A0A0U1NW17_9BACI|nr:HD domain-containing phosphohydrolase [Neobacillus massiliamazoniensis]CRK81942.1 HD domain-containing protein [Neobacillus massiliamazoniensis]
MKKQIIDPNIINEEGRTVKWFLVLFYIIYIGFDFSYTFISKYIPTLKDDTPDILRTWIYLVMFALIPLAWYLYKKQKTYQIKYIYFTCYTFLTFLNDIITYIGKPEMYKSGNIVEVLWLLLSPIFVNTSFLRVVIVGLSLKYLLVGLIIHAPNALLSLLLIAILSVFACILLSRFQAYVKAVKTSYDHQLIGIVKGVIATLELKDPYTKGHSERVASYAHVLAKETKKFTVDELRAFNYACLLHDIGKVHIPDQILMKPTKLTKEEYEIIKSHTTVGAEAVSKVEGLQNGIDVIRSHHERWDGKGYPDELKKEQIPYLARIAAIADAFDAMTSTRSYRSALPVEEAYKRILDGRDTQFDPELVDLFQEIFPIWVEIHKKLSNNIEPLQLKEVNP